MIFIDVPVVAYKTIRIDCFVFDKDGKRNYDHETEMEDGLRNSLRRYEYDPNNIHVAR